MDKIDEAIRNAAACMVSSRSLDSINGHINQIESEIERDKELFDPAFITSMQRTTQQLRSIVVAKMKQLAIDYDSAIDSLR